MDKTMVWPAGIIQIVENNVFSFLEGALSDKKFGVKFLFRKVCDFRDIALRTGHFALRTGRF